MIGVVSAGDERANRLVAPEFRQKFQESFPFPSFPFLSFPFPPGGLREGYGRTTGITTPQQDATAPGRRLDGYADDRRSVPARSRSGAGPDHGGTVSNGSKNKPRQPKTKYGSVRRLPSNRYQARMSKHLDPKGRPLPGTFDTREDAELALYAAYTAFMRGELVLPDDDAPEASQPVASFEPLAPVTVRTTMDALIAEHVDLAVKTVDGYRSISKVVICHATYGIGEMPIDTLTLPGLIAWQKRLEAQGLSAPNIAAALRALSSALSWAVDMGRLTSNPLLTRSRRNTKKSRAAKVADTVRLLSWAEFRNLVAAIPDTTHQLMVLLLAFTGMRFGELAALEPSSLLHATHELLLDHQWVKGTGKPWSTEPLKGGEKRKVYVPQGLWAMLIAYLDTWEPQAGHRKPFLFPSPASSSLRGIGIWEATLFCDKVMNPARKEAGLTVRTKDLRAFAASALVDAGATPVEAQHMLGHADVLTTMRHYVRAKDNKAHDPVRMAIRTDGSLSVHGRLDALWDAFAREDAKGATALSESPVPATSVRA